MSRKANEQGQEDFMRKIDSIEDKILNLGVLVQHP